MRTVTTIAALTCCLLAATTVNAIFCNTCVRDQCPTPTECTVGTVLDTCGCCQVCAIPEGGSCNTQEAGLCVDGTACLPDGGLLSGSLTGKCLEMTECFSFGCEAVDDESCECGYSNSCPTKTYEFSDLLSCEASLPDNSTDNSTDIEEDFDLCVSFGCEIDGDECECNTSDSCPARSFTYSTEEECQTALKAVSCAGVYCAVPQVVCPEGSYYEPGPQLPGECCPSVGVCWCDEELCPGEPDCPDGFQPFMISTANDTEGQCCDFYGCKAETCQFGDQVLQNHETVKPDACTTCFCLDGQVSCHSISCSVPRCRPDEEIVYLPDACCPTCRPHPIIDPPYVPRCEIEGEFTDPENPCLLCTCHSGRTACYEQVCPIAGCENPVSVPGTCCPVCEETQTTTEPVTEEPVTSTHTSKSSTMTVSEEIEQEATDPSTTVGATTSGTTTTVAVPSTTVRVESSSTTDSEPVDTPTTAPESINTPQAPVPEPFEPQHCSRFDTRPYRKGCLTCMCIRGRERCVDQSKSLCGTPSCANPVMVEGHCCPVCIGRTNLTPSTPSVNVPDSSVTLVAMVIDTTVMDRHSNEIFEIIETEMETISYTLLDVQTVTLGKTQVELLLAVEVVDEANMSEEQIATYLIQRLLSKNSPTTTQMLSEDSPDTNRVESHNIVIVVCVVSALVAVIVLTVFGIFLTALWIARSNKRRREIRKETEQIKA